MDYIKKQRKNAFDMFTKFKSFDSDLFNRVITEASDKMKDLDDLVDVIENKPSGVPIEKSVMVLTKLTNSLIVDIQKSTAVMNEEEESIAENRKYKKELNDFVDQLIFRS